MGEAQIWLWSLHVTDGMSFHPSGSVARVYCPARRAWPNGFPGPSAFAEPWRHPVPATVSSGRAGFATGASPPLSGPPSCLPRFFLFRCGEAHPDGSGLEGRVWPLPVPFRPRGHEQDRGPEAWASHLACPLHPRQPPGSVPPGKQLPSPGQPRRWGWGARASGLARTGLARVRWGRARHAGGGRGRRPRYWLGFSASLPGFLSPAEGAWRSGLEAGGEAQSACQACFVP